MTGGEAQAAWRLFAINWRLLTLLALVLAVSFAISGFSFGLGGALVSYGFVALYGAFAYYNAKAAHRRDPQVVYVLGCTGQIIFATCILAPLSYVAAAANLPLQDANLHAIDRALGLDWQAYVAFVSARPLLARWLALGYTMIQWPIFFIPVVLAAASRYRRLQDFILAFTLAPGGNRLHFGLCRGDRVFHHLGLAVTDFP